MLHSTRSLLRSLQRPPLRPEPEPQSNLIRLLLPLSFIHHLSILVHPLRINSVYPSLLLATCQKNICHPIDDTLAWYRKIRNTTSSRKHASRCKIGILMMNLVVRTPSLSQCIGLEIPTLTRTNHQSLSTASCTPWLSWAYVPRSKISRQISQPANWSI
jgi:hypothetical protein